MRWRSAVINKTKNEKWYNFGCGRLLAFIYQRKYLHSTLWCCSLVACNAAFNWMCQSFSTQFSFVSNFLGVWLWTGQVNLIRTTQITEWTCKHVGRLKQLIVKVLVRIEKRRQCLIAKCSQSLRRTFGFALGGWKCNAQEQNPSTRIIWMRVNWVWPTLCPQRENFVHSCRSGGRN